MLNTFTKIMDHNQDRTSPSREKHLEDAEVIAEGMMKEYTTSQQNDMIALIRSHIIASRRREHEALLAKAVDVEKSIKYLEGVLSDTV